MGKGRGKEQQGNSALGTLIHEPAEAKVGRDGTQTASPILGRESDQGCKGGALGSAVSGAVSAPPTRGNVQAAQALQRAVGGSSRAHRQHLRAGWQAQEGTESMRQVWAWVWQALTEVLGLPHLLGAICIAIAN